MKSVVTNLSAGGSTVKGATSCFFSPLERTNTEDYGLRKEPTMTNTYPYEAEDWLRQIQELIPGAEVGEDNENQIIIYTGLQFISEEYIGPHNIERN